MAASDADRIVQLASDLLLGWDYTFYRLENRLRADDLKVRAEVCALLADARASVAAAEQAYRREFLPPPSRARPRPEAEAVGNARVLEGLGHELGAAEGHIRALPTPEADRLSNRLHRESETLSRLLEADQAMVGHAAFLRSLVESASAGWMLENADRLRGQIVALEAAVRARRDLLAG